MRLPLIAKTLSDQLVVTGQKLGFSPQRAVFEHYGSDGSLAKKSGQVALTALLCFPVENTHGYEITHKESLDRCVRLLEKYLLAT